MPSTVEISCEKEYSKNANLKKEDVQNLLSWVEKQQHLPKITELQAILFLVRCKYNNEIAKQRIDSYFTTKSMLPELFKNRHEVDPRVFDVCTATVLPKAFGSFRILYIKYNECDFNNYNFVEVAKFFNKVAMLDLQQSGSCDGYVVFIDAQGSDIRHFVDTDLIRYRKILNFSRKASPVKVASMHLINQPAFISKMIPIFKQFCSEKHINKTYIHPNLDSLHRAIPKEYLPDEYGGKVGSINKIKEKCISDIVENVDFFKMEEKQVVDESKRQGKKPKNIDEIFGTEGTYKTINLMD